MVDSIELSIENAVTRRETNSLLTGIFCEDEVINGWKYDIRLLTNSDSNASRYLTTVGGHAHGLLDGFAQEDWVSGVVADIDFDKILVKRDYNSFIWTPRYKTGSFSIFSDVRRLYSDHSLMGIALADIEYNISAVELHEDCKTNTISAAIYKRLDDGLIVAEQKFTYVETFTGSMEETGDERAATETEGGELIVENFSDRHAEFITRDNLLYLNGLYEVQVGLGTDVDDIRATWEYHNPQAGGYMFLKYLNPQNVEVVVVAPDDSVTSLTEYSSLAFVSSTDVGYSVDEDLGVIEITGKTAEPVTLSAAIDNIVTSIPCYRNDDFLNLPDRGIVLIGSELIAYGAKGVSSLESCVRGHDSTTPSGHVKGALAYFNDRGSFPSGDIYVKYTAVPRVDYEITTYEKRTANKTNWLDVHPLNNLNTKKIIQIVSTTVNLSRITLTTDENVIGGNLYGPVYFGTDVARFVATAYDSNDNPVEDLELTIEKIAGPGTLNNDGSSVIAESNSSGEMYAFYNAPYSESAVTLSTSDISHDGSDTLVTVPGLPTGLALSDIYIYQVLKHDPVLGTVGKRVTAVAGGAATLPWGHGYLDCRCEYTEDFNGGHLQIVYSSTRYSLRIRHAVQINVFGEEPLTRFYTYGYIAPMGAGIFTPSSVWLYQPDAEVWDTTLQRGAQVIVYEWSNNYKHPITEATGAYGPLRPSSISGTVLRFNDRLLPLPAPTDDTSNLGGYVVVAPAEARFWAYGRDPYSGNIISSNEIRTRIVLPNFLSGVDSSGVLPIPYGFTFITDDFNIGAGLGGSNFLTVNPSASGINQFSLRGTI